VAKMRFGMLLQQLNFSMDVAPAEDPAEDPAEETSTGGTPANIPENTPAP
jgi:hypothetical protein